MYKIINYDRVYSGCISIIGANKINMGLYSTGNSREYKGKFGVLYSYEDDNPASYMNYSVRESANVSVTEDTKVFVSSLSKLPRDFVRNTCKITRSKENADYVLIPRPKTVYKTNYIPAIIEWDDDAGHHCDLLFLYINDCESRIARHSSTVEGLKESIKTEIKYIYRNYLFDSTSYSLKICDFDECGRSDVNFAFFPKCEEYVDILQNGEHSKYKYVYDYSFPITTPVEINEETLQIWSKCDDVNMLEKNIMQSNWKEYPVLISLVLFWEFRYSSSSDIPSAIRSMMAFLGVDNMLSDRKFKDGTIITPKDMEMIQKWISIIFDFNGKSGFVSTNNFSIINRFPFDYFLMKKIAVVTPNISHDMPLKELRSIVQENS